MLLIVKFILRRYCTFYFTLRNVLVSNRISLSVEVARWIIVYSEAVYCVIINENEFYFNFQLIIKISLYTKIHCTKSVTIYRACWYGFAYMKETFPVFLFLKLLNLLLLLIFSCLIIKPAVVLLFIRCIIHFIIPVYLMYHIILIDWINELKFENLIRKSDEH